MREPGDFEFGSWDFEFEIWDLGFRTLEDEEMMS